MCFQGNYAQQSVPNNQNVGVNNAIEFQQQALQRTYTPNNMNQTPNGGLNINLPQQSNIPQQDNLQQSVNGNFQRNLQPSMSLQANLQPSGVPGSLGNMQFAQQGLPQMSPGLVINPSKSQSCPTQMNNGCRQNAQSNQQQNNMGFTTNVSPPQTQTAPCSSNLLTELAALKGQPSLLSLFASQNNIAQPQQNEQMVNFISSQNQLTDIQKQNLVRAVQPQSSGQNQPGVYYTQNQFQPGGSPDNHPSIIIQTQPVSAQQSQATVNHVASQQPYITVQAQPITNYLQNQPPQLVEEPSMLNLILSGLQGSGPQYNMYPTYSLQKKESKSSLKSLIPLIIDLLQEKNNCGCPNCGYPNNGNSSNPVPAPTIFGGYSSLMNYGQGTVETSTKATFDEEIKSNSNKRENKNNIDSAEGSEEDSEEMDYSDED